MKRRGEEMRTKCSSGKGKGIPLGFVIPVLGHLFFLTLLLLFSYSSASSMTNLIYRFSYLHFKVTRFFFTFVFQLGSFRGALHVQRMFAGGPFIYGLGWLEGE